MASVICKQAEIVYVPAWAEPDDSYRAAPDRQRACKKCIFNKVSWILQGQDREAEFIKALRKLYKEVSFPDVATGGTISPMRPAEEPRPALKQLIGLARFGPRMYLRDEQTHELITGSAIEQPSRRRIRTHQVIFNKIHPLSKAGGPRQSCMALRDAICGLLNAFRMGYVHREITPEVIYFVKHECEHSMGYMLSKSGQSVEGSPRRFSGYIYDFPVCQKKYRGKKDYLKDTEIFKASPTMPIATLGAENREEVIHSPINDLESFLWVLLLTATDTINDYVAGRRRIKVERLKGVNAEPECEKGNPSCESIGQQPVIDDSASKLEVKENQTNEEFPAQDIPSGEVTVDEPQSNTDQEAIAIDVEGGMAIEEEHYPVEMLGTPMDVDDDKVQVNETEDHGEVATIEEAIPEPEGVEERKRKANSEADSKEAEGASKKAKGEEKNTGETNDGETALENRGSLSKEQPPRTWYIRELHASTSDGVQLSSDLKPPQGSKASEKPRYVAFAEDKNASTINTLLRPREPDTTIDKVTRLQLLHDLNQRNLSLDSAGLSPFAPLIRRLVGLAIEYQNLILCESPKRELAKHEIEEAFALYLDAFEKHMPEQDSWLY